MNVIVPVVLVNTTASASNAPPNVVPPELVTTKSPKPFDDEPTVLVTEIVPVPGVKVKFFPAPAIL